MGSFLVKYIKRKRDINMNVYLDNSATTKPYEQVTQQMMEMLQNNWANPSSLYPKGLDAELAVRDARDSVEKVFGSRGKTVFTGSGTESDNMAIFGGTWKMRHQGREIITTEIEHPAVLRCMDQLESQGWTINRVSVDENCHLDMEQLESLITDNTALISVMLVNNETGSVQPINEINKMKKNALLHVDAVQAMGKLDLRDIDADLVSVSGHKIHGPKGTGALYINQGVKIPPYIYGGGQEDGLRSGTENTPGIAGFGMASKLLLDNFQERVCNMKKARTRLLEGLSNIDDIRVNSPEDGSPSVLNVSFMGTRGEVLLHTLEQDGIMVSTGSACSSGSSGGSHVLKAMGLNNREIEGAIRFSFSEFNTVEQMDYVAEKTAIAVKRFRRLGSFR